MSEKESSHEKSSPRSGKSMGVCKVCGNQFRLKRKTKHSAAKLLTGIICPACGTHKKPEVKK
jgi:ssDNA-binding Zn-finger/Zn-ribbon topoisomerase 1